MEDEPIIFRSDFENFPPGLRFLPSDEELVLVYLKPKADNQPQPPHRIWDVNVYGSDPYTLTENYQPHGDEEWYFFTPLYRKYPRGTRVNRADQKGYWKQSGGEIEISNGGGAVGAKRALVYYKELPKHDNNEKQKMKDNSVKTEWLMQEYTLQKMKDIAKPAQQENTDMTLDPCVLCKIYKNVGQVEPLEEEPIAEEVQVNVKINATINHNTSVHNPPPSNPISQPPQCVPVEQRRGAQSSNRRMTTYNQPQSLPYNIPQTSNYIGDNFAQSSNQRMATYNQPEPLPYNIPQTFNYIVDNSAQSSNQVMATYNQPEPLPYNIPQTFNYMVDNPHHLSSQTPNMAAPEPGNSTYQSNHGHLMTINPQLSSNLSFQQAHPQPLDGFDSFADQPNSYYPRCHIYLGEQLPNHSPVDIPPQPILFRPPLAIEEHITNSQHNHIPFLSLLAMEEYTTNPQHNLIPFSQPLAIEEYITNLQHNPIPFSPSLTMKEYTTNLQYNPIPFSPPLTMKEHTTNLQHSSNPLSQELQPNSVDPLQPLDPHLFFQQNTPPLPPVHDDVPARQSFN